MKKIQLILVLFFVCTLPMHVFAQLEPGEDPDVPIDGGISILLATGIGIGVKKIKDVAAQKKRASKN